jgi:hypothetical protein
MYRAIYFSYLQKTSRKKYNEDKSQFSFNSKPQDNKRQKKQTTLDEKNNVNVQLFFLVIIFY